MASRWNGVVNWFKLILTWIFGLKQTLGTKEQRRDYNGKTWLSLSLTGGGDEIGR